MPLITQAQLATVAPKADAKIAAAIADSADDVLPRYGLTTPARMTDFLAHVLVESAYLTTLAENLNYSATRLMEVWPSRFPTLGSTSGFAHVPEALACKVYNGRLGNNNARDGWIYRGQGLLQITGKDNFQGLAKQISKPLDTTMALVTSTEGMLECAAAVYVMLGAPAYADRGDIVGSTKRVNGGTNGLADRKAMLAKCQKIWGNLPTAGIASTPDAPVLNGIIAALNAAAKPVSTPPRAPLVQPVTAPPHLLPPAASQGWFSSLLSMFKRA